MLNAISREFAIVLEEWETMEKKNVDCLTKISTQPEERGFPLKHTSKLLEHRMTKD